MPLQCRSTSICPECQEQISPGDLTRPTLHVSGDPVDLTTKVSASKPPIVWCHWDCVAATDPRIPLCKHFLRHASCMYEAACAFRHDRTPTEAAAAQLSAGERIRPRHGTYQRRKVYNEGKCAAVRRWLLAVFGEAYLRGGAGVLDVAGGKGELSFELLNLNGVPCTVIDPRPLRLHRYKRKLAFGYYHRNDALGKYNSRPPPREQSVPGEDCEIPRHIRAFFEMSGEDASLPPGERFHFPAMLADESGAQFSLELQRAAQVSWTARGLEHEDEAEVEIDIDDGAEEPEPEGEADAAAAEVREAAEARALVRGASLVVGLHPDQAAEHVVDFCLRNCVPFALVPCCVYRRQFPGRRHPASGAAVSSYADLVEYLLAKSPGGEIGAAQLDFEGKNVLLYYLGGRAALSDPCQYSMHICRGAATPATWAALSQSTKDCSACTAAKRSRTRHPANRDPPPPRSISELACSRAAEDGVGDSGDDPDDAPAFLELLFASSAL